MNFRSRTYCAMTLLSSSLLLFSCNPSNEGGVGSQYPGSDQYGEQVDLSSREKSLMIGTYYLDSWTADEPKDWNGDGVVSTDLLTEFDMCYQDNSLYIGTEIYIRKDLGALCQGTEEEGDVLIQGDWGFGYDETTSYSLISFKDEAGLVVQIPFREYYIPDGLTQMELFQFGGRKTMIGKIWDPLYESHDVVIYRTE